MNAEQKRAELRDTVTDAMHEAVDASASAALTIAASALWEVKERARHDGANPHYVQALIDAHWIVAELGRHVEARMKA